VVSIIALLVSILVPALAKARDQAKRTVCAAQMYQMGLGSSYYTAENRDKYPYGNYLNFPFATYPVQTLASMKTKDVASAIREYIDKETRLFYCPGSELVKGPRYKDLVENRNEIMTSGASYYLNYHIGYLYFGNHVTKENGMFLHVTPEMKKNIEEGFLFPQSTMAKRCILFADILTNCELSWTQLNHPYPNALYTDGSVVGRHETVLNKNMVPAGYWYKW